MTRYVLRELEHLAERAQVAPVAPDNIAVVRRTQSRVQGRADRNTILSVLHEGRGDRGSSTPASSWSCLPEASPRSDPGTRSRRHRIWSTASSPMCCGAGHAVRQVRQAFR